MNRRPKPKGTDVAAAAAWIKAVLGPCIMCGAPRSQGHHGIEQQVLRRYAAEHGIDPQPILWDVRVGFPLCARCHALHHSGSRPVPMAKLPAAVIRFAIELDERYTDGRDPMTLRLERTYPR